MSVRVFALRLQITIHRKLSTAFQFLYMTLPIDTADGRGLSNEVHCELLPKKTKVMLYLLFVSQ